MARETGWIDSQLVGRAVEQGMLGSGPGLLASALAAARAVASQPLGPPEKQDLKVGFIPIIRATPITMAGPMGG